MTCVFVSVSVQLEPFQCIFRSSCCDVTFSFVVVFVILSILYLSIHEWMNHLIYICKLPKKAFVKANTLFKKSFPPAFSMEAAMLKSRKNAHY